MTALMFGTTGAEQSADVRLIRETGIEWIRQKLAMPFVDRIGGQISEEYLRSKAQVQLRIAQGLKVMGTTPLPYSARHEPDEKGILRMRVEPNLPDWLGVPGSDTYNRGYEEICAWMANDLRGIVAVWQIANELDIDLFAGPLTARQSCELIVHSARGLKSADSSLMVGHNPAGVGPHSDFFYGWLYGRNKPLLDYCGVDGYYGSWTDGGPESWDRRLTELAEMTGMPILINEWGFSSEGQVLAPGELQPNQLMCQLCKWPSTWGPGHTPEGQAAFVRECFDVFRAHRKSLLGLFFHTWGDQENCWQCGRADCPMETRWGLVDLNGKPKPAWKAYQEGIASMKSSGLR